MALIHCDFFSDVLGLSMSMDVILPQPTTEQIGLEGSAAAGPHPCLYLLHGLSDDHTIWQRRTSIERYVAPLGLAVVMPNVHRSFYTDMAHGGRYWTYVTEEVPALARSFFPLSAEREHNFVAGLSMGGYGAFKVGMRCADRFGAAASLSGVMDVARVRESHDKDMHLVFGDGDGVAPEHDLFALAEGLAARSDLRLPLYQCCGTEDFLYDHNTRFRDHAQRLGLDLTYEERPGVHEWGFWDTQIQRVLDWLPLPAADQED